MKTELLQNTAHFLFFFINVIWNQGRVFISQFGIVSVQIGCLQLDRNHSRNSFSQHANSPTSQQANLLIIAIKDNGSGIPDAIKDKIFQPFFTTKPTGQGTGLGLSLSYDIVKAHRGKLSMETTDGVGSEFIIQLPIQNNLA